MADSFDQMRKGTTILLLLKLLADVDGPLHGYEMIRRLQERSQGAFRFREGLVYPTLHRMQHEGLLESHWQGQPGTRRRKVYIITEKGRQRLQLELQRWQALSQAMDRMLYGAEADICT